MGETINWAEHEVQIAIARERKSGEGPGFEYAKGCYESALKAFRSLCEDEHSGMSFSITADILRRLIKRQPLTPIEDDPDEWVEAWISDDGVKHYQHRRLSSLFKDVDTDGKASYNDNGAYVCIDEETHIPYQGGGAWKLFQDYYEVSFPYSPPLDPYKIVTREYLTDRKNGDFDTKEYAFIITPDGKQIPVYRFFKEFNNEWKEIKFEEFLERIKLHNERERKEQEGENQNGSI